MKHIDKGTAKMESGLAPAGRPIPTGIKVKVTRKDTGEEVHYGVQFNNTTGELESLPDLKVEVVSRKEGE